MQKIIVYKIVVSDYECVNVGLIFISIILISAYNVQIIGSILVSLKNTCSIDVSPLYIIYIYSFS